jgi:hypothetical protein
MKKQKYPLLILLVIATFPILSYTPLYAISMLEGLTYDQSHNTGYMDWSGSVGVTTVKRGQIAHC